MYLRDYTEEYNDLLYRFTSKGLSTLSALNSKQIGELAWAKWRQSAPDILTEAFYDSINNGHYISLLAQEKYSDAMDALQEGLAKYFSGEIQGDLNAKHNEIYPMSKARQWDHENPTTDRGYSMR